jgi:hypothetical protein
MSFICACKLRVFSLRIDMYVLDIMDSKSYVKFHFAMLRRRCILVSIFCFTLKLSIFREFRKYKDFMFLTRDKVFYTGPWIRIPTGSNATLSSVKPCDLCILRAHASLIGIVFRYSNGLDFLLLIVVLLCAIWVSTLSKCPWYISM